MCCCNRVCCARHLTTVGRGGSLAGPRHRASNRGRLPAAVEAPSSLTYELSSAPTHQPARFASATRLSRLMNADLYALASLRLSLSSSRTSRARPRCSSASVTTPTRARQAGLATAASHSHMIPRARRARGAHDCFGATMQNCRSELVGRPVLLSRSSVADRLWDGWEHLEFVSISDLPGRSRLCWRCDRNVNDAARA